MDWEQVRAWVHVAAALSAIVVGAVVLALPKGTPRHRGIGVIYAVLLVAVNLAALSLHREASFGTFHVLALLSLATLVIGLAPLLVGLRSPRAVVTHAYCLPGSYAGLLAAGFGQLAATATDRVGPWVVPVTIASVLIVCTAVIIRVVPPAVGRVLA